MLLKTKKFVKSIKVASKRKQRKRIHRKKGEETLTISSIINDNKTHDEMIVKVIENETNKGKNIKFYHTLTELQEDWSLSDYHYLEDKFLLYKERNSNADIKNVERLKKLSDKFTILQENYMIVAKGIADWNKDFKAVGMLYPVPEAIEFYFDSYFYFTIDVLSDINKNKNKNNFLNYINTDNINSYDIYKHMVTNEISNLIIIRYSENKYSIILDDVPLDEKIIENAFTKKTMKILTRKILDDIGGNQNSKEPELSGAVHFSIENIENALDLKVKDTTFRVILSKQSNIYKYDFGEIDYLIHIRNLDAGKKIRRPEEIGYMEKDREAIIEGFYDKALMQIKKKLTVFLGEPSSGKSTSEASFIKYEMVEKYKLMVLWLDKLQEFQIEGVHHKDFSEDKNSKSLSQKDSWAKALTSSLKINYDLICYGEIIEDEDIKACIEAISRGRGIFTTNHTTDCHGFILKLHGLGFKPVQYVSYLGQLIHQQFVPRLCECKGLDADCPTCKGTGKDGKVLIYERASFSNDLPANADLVNNFYKYINEGLIDYRSKYEVALDKYNNGEISVEILESFKRYERTRC